MTSSIILSSVYGYEGTPPDDTLVQVAEKAMNSLSEAALPGSKSNLSLPNLCLNMILDFYVNTVPWMIYVPTWFPGAAWKRKAQVWRVAREEMINKSYEWTKTQVVWYSLAPVIVHHANALSGGGNCPPIYS